MYIVLIGVVLLLANKLVGMVVIVLGVMVWTSRKSRETRQNVDVYLQGGTEVAGERRKRPVTEIVAVRRDRNGPVTR